MAVVEFGHMSARVYFVVPAYNESEMVGLVVEQVRRNWPNVVVVDDGSADDTAAKAARAGAAVLQHLINRGQGAALKTGIDYALACGADVIVTFDSDGQHQLADINAFLAPVIEGRADGLDDALPR